MLIPLISRRPPTGCSDLFLVFVGLITSKSRRGVLQTQWLRGMLIPVLGAHGFSMILLLSQSPASSSPRTRTISIFLQRQCPPQASPPILICGCSPSTLLAGLSFVRAYVCNGKKWQPSLVVLICRPLGEALHESVCFIRASVMSSH